MDRRGQGRTEKGAGDVLDALAELREVVEVLLVGAHCGHVARGSALRAHEHERAGRTDLWLGRVGKEGDAAGLVLVELMASSRGD